jgi:hypothetical protein
MHDTKIPDDTTPFEDHYCGHLPCPPWIEEGATDPTAVAAEPDEEELDPPLHVHDLWAVLGLGKRRRSRASQPVSFHPTSPR